MNRRRSMASPRVVMSRLRVDVDGAIDRAHAAFAEVVGDAVGGDLGGLRAHLRKPSVQFNTTVIGTASWPTGSELIRNRLPSEVTAQSYSLITPRTESTGDSKSTFGAPAWNSALLVTSTDVTLRPER